MKILIRDNADNLVWREVIYRNDHFKSLDGSMTYCDNVIYAVKDDDRNKTVICSYCGEEVKNTPSAIRAHRAKLESPHKCFECPSLKTKSAVVVSRKYVRNEDGTYHESTKRNVELICDRRYPYRDINSAEAKQACRYYGCANALFNPISDFWTNNPNAFDEFITVDRIVDAKYRQITKFSNGFRFTLKGKTRLVVDVNKQGLCVRFRLHYYNNQYELRYSKKYDTVYVVDSYGIRTIDHFDISEATIGMVIRKFRTLYN